MRDGSITDDEALAAQQLNERILGVSQEPIGVRAQSVASSWLMSKTTPSSVS